MSLKKNKGINNPEILERLGKQLVKVDLGEALFKDVFYCEKNVYIWESDTLFYKGKNCKFKC